MTTNQQALTQFPEYTSYRQAGSFWGITEEQFVGYLAAKSVAEDASEKPPRMKIINSSDLPNSLAALVDTIRTSQDVHDQGYSNATTLNAALPNALILIERSQ